MHIRPVEGSGDGLFGSHHRAKESITIGATGSDAIALILFHHAEQPVGLFSLDGHPHLKAVAIEPTDLTAYRALTGLSA